MRSPKLAGVIGLALGAITAYLAWVVWIFAASEQQALVLFPGGLLGTLGDLAKEGAWGIFGFTPTGGMFYAIWGVEALMIVGVSGLAAWISIGITPYCEHCNQWIEEPEKVEFLEPLKDDEETLKKKLEAGDFSALLELKKVPPSAQAFSELELLHCSKCKMQELLTVRSATITKDDDGSDDRDDDDLVELLIISADLRGKLAALKDAKMAPEQAPPPPKE